MLCRNLKKQPNRNPYHVFAKNSKRWVIYKGNKGSMKKMQVEIVLKI